jgi:DNA repair protein RadC
MAGDKHSGDHAGFSEEALRALRDFEAQLPPPEVYERALADDGRAFARAGVAGRVDQIGQAVRPAGDPRASDRRPHYWGHRERLRQRFVGGGADALPDYELLELVLFNAIPRVDVKPLAKQLLAIFGDFNGVVAAPRARLLAVPGVTEKVWLQFRVHEAVAARMARAMVLNREVITSWSQLMNYCKTVMAHRETEQFRVLFLDRKNVLIGDEAQGAGTVDHVPVYPREVAKRALELNASAIILVHNHPSGDPTPSKQDIEMTGQIDRACRALGITVHDHVVIGKEKDASFKSLGLL